MRPRTRKNLITVGFILGRLGLKGFWGSGLRGFKLSTRFRVRSSGCRLHVGALIITYTVVAAPYYKYSTLGPKTLFYLL